LAKMPPRKKKAGGGKDGGSGGGGGALSALGGLGKKKSIKAAKPPKPHGGLVQTLGWLWRMGKPLPRALPEPEPSSDDDDEPPDAPSPPPLRPLPSFLVLNLVPPGSGDEFKVAGRKKNHAVLEASSSLMVGELRVRVRDFLAEWQKLQDEKKDDNQGGGAKEPGSPVSPKAPQATAAKKIETKQKDAKKGKKGKSFKGGGMDSKGEGAAPVKLVAPEPMLLTSGRRAWGDSVRVGAAVSQVGASCDSGAAGDGDSWLGRLPWASFGPEVLRYGPVVVVLGSVGLDAPHLDEAAAAKLDAAKAAARARLMGHGAQVATAAATLAVGFRGTRTVASWQDAGGKTHLAPEVSANPLRRRTMPTCIHPPTRLSHSARPTWWPQLLSTSGGGPT
jgi:hypothetical protein